VSAETLLGALNACTVVFHVDRQSQQRDTSQAVVSRNARTLLKQAWRDSVLRFRSMRFGSAVP